ncbi:MAG: class I SAM-dependent methyltransferase [Thermoplasmatota archaeon]
MSDQDKVSSRYDSWTPFYDMLDNIPVLSSPQKRWKKSAVKALELEGDEKVLDIGTGTGEILPWIAEYLDDGVVIGTDISKGMLRRTKTKIKKNDLENKVKVVYDDIENSRFSKDSFDKIIATFTFTTVPDPKRTAEECKRILKKDGEIVVLDTGKPENKIYLPLFYPMNFSAKIFGRTHMNRPIQQIISDYFEVKKRKTNMLGMVYQLKCKK